MTYSTFSAALWASDIFLLGGLRCRVGRTADKRRRRAFLSTPAAHRTKQLAARCDGCDIPLRIGDSTAVFSAGSDFGDFSYLTPERVNPPSSIEAARVTPTHATPTARASSNEKRNVSVQKKSRWVTMTKTDNRSKQERGLITKYTKQGIELNAKLRKKHGVKKQQLGTKQNVLWERQNGRCKVCRVSLNATAQANHLIPLHVHRARPGYNKKNGKSPNQLLCVPCHKNKTKRERA